MARLDKDREQKLQPIRINEAVKQIEALGHKVHFKSENNIKFMFKDNEITYFPYSGWASGKGITDGRGINNLLKQIK
jgi:hypothetical protein